MKEIEKHTTKVSTGNKDEDMREFKQDRIGDIEDKGGEGLSLIDIKPKSQGRRATKEQKCDGLDFNGYMEG